MMPRKRVMLSVSVIAMLVLSAISIAIPSTPTAAAQAQLPKEQRNWEMINHNSLGTNYNPQTQINKENVGLLELKWLFPIPNAATQGGKDLVGFGGFFGLAEGSIAPPIVADGIIYLLTNAHAVFALNAENGKQVWVYTSKFNATEAAARLPIGATAAHGHGMFYIDGKIWLNTFGCRLVSLDALTGRVVDEFKDLCANVPTNSGLYSSGGFGSHPPVQYKKGNTIIYAVGADIEGTFGGRAFVAGYDMTTKALKWRFFYQPPDGKKFPAEKAEWGQFLVDNCKKIWIQQISACDVPQDILRNDWGDMPPNAGVSNIWGQMAVDEDAGIIYFGTAQPGPDWNATGLDGKVIPGYRLFGSSVMAIRATTGEFIWAHQTTTRDLWDWDCSWNTILATANVGGQTKKVVIKGCKNGRVHALDAATGQALWVYDSPAIKRTQYANFLDPKNRDDMVKPWQNYPSKEPLWQNCQGTGCLESDIAFDGKTVYAGIYNSPSWSKIVPVRARGDYGLANPPAPYTPKVNSTVTAIDVSTGKMKWEYFIDGVGFRGGTIVSGGVVFFNGHDGNTYGLDAETGKLLWKRFVGSVVDSQPTIGATADGKMRLFQVFGGSIWRQAVPGALMVFGLPDKLPEPQIITKEVIKEVPKEVVKEVIKEVPKEVVKEVVKEVPKEVIKEVVKEVPKEVVKEVPKEVIKTVTVETISPVSYAAIGIGVVMVVISAVMMSRRKKA